MPHTSLTKPIDVPAPPRLEEAATAVMDELRAALSGLVASLDGSAARAVDVQRLLGVDRKLAWQVFRLVHSQGLDEAANVPARPSVRRLLAASRSVGVPDGVTQRVEAAFEQFESFTSEHAEDRQELMSLLAGITGISSEQFELSARKSLFRGNAHVWGVQAKMLLRTMIHHPGEGSGDFRSVLLSGNIGLQRRPGRPLAISSGLIKEHGGAPHPGQSPGAEAPSQQGRPQESSGPQLLLDHCSRPLPELAPRPSVGGKFETEIIFPAAGRAGAITMYLWQSMTSTEDMTASAHGSGLQVTIPTESVVCDLMLPTGWTEPASARVAVYGRRHHPEHVFEERQMDLFPQRETVRYFGRVENIPPISGAGQHQIAVRDVLARQGWLGTSFDVYRCHIRYPVLHSLVVLRVDTARKQST